MNARVPCPPLAGAAWEELRAPLRQLFTILLSPGEVEELSRGRIARDSWESLLYAELTELVLADPAAFQRVTSFLRHRLHGEMREDRPRPREPGPLAWPQGEARTRRVPWARMLFDLVDAPRFAIFAFGPRLVHEVETAALRALEP